MNKPSKTTITRRKFITTSAISAGGLALLSIKPAFAHSLLSAQKQYTVQQVIDLILKEGNLLPIPNTVDTFKSGDGNTIVTGIVTTMFATVDVIKQTAKLGANFIIAHEPTFYNHLDDPNWVKDNSVVKQKQALLKKYDITIWRFHDYIHSLKPDAVEYGSMKKFNWLQYFNAESPTFTIPQLSLSALVQHVKTSLGIAHLRVIGDLKQPCSRITYLPGAPGGKMQVDFAERDKPDVLIVGELSEWETAEYIRDARLFGSKISLIVLGHNFSEDPGMDYFVEWLQPKLAGVKITHIKSGDPFTWL
ncbi:MULTISPECIES: Nif3-like dinuclear metal center hexameric protein [unclassified Mucilaginibacter]|uniref:Nif3-like dinuclear metal center hexameric protein n=1 Tax=unclassified Mucilaginibacter TaxID=2617802 RepID=UPI002AC964E5|nr:MULTISPECIES: Nif3-like dinuclear metal center hexameric protein [unclassified Mucilaginibacter]MEB0262688.1 Nif3-like dinuclear metal center hexameric protein [Mucilaginibacter sp. 10I4]MEB0279474.1 Nif3-like dinuclear metal center hexameric protein [Mucilaginibacter sp. 10B2]MEB0300035.1 Nif3-like dinuclear metal center hexameric protein [Mucilaginibacter sp. 5C4]WPX21848.1 Nif3-like dinuclear metal center hexameric protein [Mucilaginibacter sp. 5C4]